MQRRESIGAEAQDAARNVGQPSLVCEGDSKIVYGEGDGVQASMKIPTSNSLANTDGVEGLREQRKFAESTPRRFQDEEELYEEKAQKQREFAQKRN